MREWLVAAGLALAACASNTEPSNPSFRLLGRYEERADSAFAFAWPASGVEARFEGTRIVARIEDSGENLMDVRIDGVTTMLDLEPGVHDYVLFESGAPGEHVISLTRKSEIFDSGISVLLALEVDGRSLPTPVRAHRMLVLGDSLSVGYGATGADATCSYSAETGAPLQSYASQTANAFDADLHLIAISGRGVVRNWDDDPRPVMPWQIDKALPDQEGPRWDQARFQPELVIVNLGTNDFSQIDPGARFHDGATAMWRALHAAYPNARLMAAFGPNDKENANAAVRAGAEAFTAESGAPVPFVSLAPAASGHVWGCDYHPGLDSHAVMAETLIAAIERELGWTRAAR